MRVYLPATVPSLRRAAAAGAVGPAPVVGAAVTPALREWYAEGDLEELEYAALAEAAVGSLRLLATDGTAPPRRVVLAAEVEDAAVAPYPQAGRAGVLISRSVPLDRLVSAHIDDDEAGPDVRAAAAAVAAADRGDGDAQFTVDGAADHELLWYAASEIAAVISL